MAQEARYYAEFTGENPATVQGFEPVPELFNLQAGMEMLGMPSKQQREHQAHNPSMWRSFNSGIMVSPPESNNHPWQQQQQGRMIVDDSSLRCLFPAEGNTSTDHHHQQQQQSRGLSLFPADAGVHGSLFAKSLNINHHHHHNQNQEQQQQQQQQQILMQDGRFYPSCPSPQNQSIQLRSSKYLSPAQELLNEFCNLGGANNSTLSKQKQQKSSQWEEGGPSSSSSNTWTQSLYSMDLLELQKRKARLLSMLEEVDRRYRKYCEQMRAVVSSFEAVAGDGAATVYSTLASKAMSRHFRCLRDGIVNQVKATRKAMGEKDPVAPGTTRGETPRLKLLDQCLRQQKAFQQAGMLESHPWRPQRGLPERSVSVLRAWLFEHFLHPYPSDVDKHILARQTGLSRSQVSNWFINARVRLWKPMVEEMYLEEVKEQENQSSNQSLGNEDTATNPNPNPNPNQLMMQCEDQKPLINDSDSLSSIINSSHQKNHHPIPATTDNFGVVDLDFSSYNECAGSHQSFGNGVSLTLGLQQHTGGGMSLSFSPASQHSLFFSRDNIEDCQPVQFSILDGEAQNLPYRNLMGAQLLHDLAG
ncbi:hypothetical protein J5N97_029425 [Dioscorea zingiberensis]|uniref:Homeobox domain-containing protein n=1 Tax=Dioscorea zingiberensis TaxID=325984 RepID=A0A9D5C1K5_9LILI|nr:hypothetical protein J5N97_029425 [Dioscorea zingiberensis]